MKNVKNGNNHFVTSFKKEVIHPSINYTFPFMQNKMPSSLLLTTKRKESGRFKYMLIY